MQLASRIAARRGLQRTSFSTIGRFQLPAVVGEPFRHYPPGSEDALQLSAACKETRGEVLDIPCIVNGKEYFTGDIMTQTMPSDHGHVLANIHKATPEIIADAIKTADANRLEWANMPFEHRMSIFRKAADLVASKYRYKMNASTMLGQGKTVWQAEIDSAVETIDFFRLNTHFAQEIYNVQPPLNSPNTWNRLEYRELEGFIVAISPFNFTAIGLNLPTSPAMMGNTVLWKPASTAVLSNYLGYRILLEAGLPPGVISFLPCAGKTIGPALDHESFAGLHFTGSTSTFNTLWSQIGNNLDKYKTYPRIVGETGGKNFHMVHPSADMKHTAFNTIRGAFEYQGQKCSAASRLYVPQSMWEGQGMKDLMVETTKGLHQGQPDDFKSFLSAVIDKSAFNDHVEYLETAKKDDVEIIVGGNYSDKEGYFVEPTIIVTKDPQYRTMKEEIFGPILTVYVYDDSKPNAWANACHLCNNTSPFGLTGSIFSQDRGAIIEAAEILKHACGNMYLNDKSTGAVVGEQPFGGARASGTNDKAGSHLNLLRWVSAKTIKENTVPITTHDYPHMQ